MENGQRSWCIRDSSKYLDLHELYDMLSDLNLSNILKCFDFFFNFIRFIK